MLETGFAQIRFAASILFGTRFSLRSLDHLIASLQVTQREFGFLRSEGRDLLVSPQLDEETRRAMQLRRFRSQAVRAVRETVYYQRLFERLGLDPGRVRYEEIAHLPLMVVLGPLMGLQYLYWRRRRGQERTTWHYLQEEPMQPLGERLDSQQEAH